MSMLANKFVHAYIHKHTHTHTHTQVRGDVQELRNALTFQGISKEDKAQILKSTHSRLSLQSIA